jgi:hypothetical protein
VSAQAEAAAGASQGERKKEFGPEQARSVAVRWERRSTGKLADA